MLRYFRSTAGLSLMFAGLLAALWILGLFVKAPTLGRLYLELFPPDAVQYYSPWWKFALGAARSLASDAILVLYALAVSVAIGVFVSPVHVGERLGKYLSVFLTTVPYFVILSSLMYSFPDEYELLFLVLGAVVSARLLILLVNRFEDVEKDEYVLFMALSGRSRYGVSLRYSMLQSMESVFPTVAWNFTTLLTFTVFLSFMGMGGLQRISLGGYFRILYDNFNTLAVYMRGTEENWQVVWHGLLRYSFGIGYFIALNYTFHELMETARKDFLRYVGASPVVGSASKRERSGELWRKLLGVSIRHVEVVSNFTSKTLIEFSGELNFRTGDVMLITGESGSGKTLFVSSIAGMLRGSKLSLKAEVVFRTDSGEHVVRDDFERVVRSGLVEFIPQNPRESFDRYTRISEYLEDLGILEEVREIIRERFDTPRKKPSEDLDKYPSEVSDGVLQIINLSLLYVRAKSGGKILILDEPTASLSHENVKRALDLLKEVFSVNTTFWIDHDPAVVELVPFNRFLRVVQKDGVSSVKELSRDEFELDRTKKTRVREIFEALKGGSGERVLRFEVEEIEFGGGKRLRIDHGGPVEVKRGGVYFIVGDNGAGKTSLLKVLVGYYRRFKGEVIYDGAGDIRGDRKGVWKIVDILLQNADASLPSYARVSDIVPDASTLEELNLRGKGSLRVYQLSYGQKKRLMLARIISRKPRVVFLDEPNASLDVDNFLNIVSKLAEVFPKTGSALVIITHDREIIPAGAEVIEIRGGIT